MEKKLLVEEQISKNKRDTVLVCTFMALLFIGIIFAFGIIFFQGNILISLIFALPISIGYVLMMYSVSVKTVLSAAKARPANQKIREEKLLIHRVEEMSIASGLPMPKVYVQDSEYINAFATGRNPSEGIVCVTTGALYKLNQEELTGVIAHEMSHIKNYDIRVATVTIAVVGAISLLSEIVFYSMFWGGAGRGSRRDGGGGIIIVIAILFAILAPIFARLTYLAISRRREYLADSTGAYLSRNPEGLAKALEKIKKDVPRTKPKGSKTVAPLYISNPFKKQSIRSMWSTHPPLDERIRRLRSM
jgi:heat shock protein HtpX